MRFKFLIRGLFICGVVLLAGCAAPLSPLSPTHPANPLAPEAPLPPPSTALRDVPAVDASSDEPEPPAISGHHHSAPASGTSYRCPMHADVHSDRPGNCPVCGMRLREEQR
jgi:Cu(I)/Ag(I) efflux system membrane fusion protein